MIKAAMAQPTYRYITLRELRENEAKNATMHGFYMQTMPSLPIYRSVPIPDIVLAIAVVAVCVMIGIAIAKFSDFIYDKYINRFDRVRARSRLLARATALTFKTDSDVENAKSSKPSRPSTIAVSAAVKWMSKAGDTRHTQPDYVSPSDGDESESNPRNPAVPPSNNSATRKSKKRKTTTTLMQFTPSLTNDDNDSAFPRKKSALSLGATAKWISTIDTKLPKGPILEYSTEPRRTSRSLAIGTASQWMTKVSDRKFPQEQEPLTSNRSP